MILKTLCDYYDHSKDMPVLGCMQKKIEYLIVIDEDGNLKNIESTRIDKNTVKSFSVAAEADRTNGVKPFLFNDNVEYTCGYSPKKDIDKSQIKNKAFIDRCREISQKYPDDLNFKAVVRFYENDGINKIYENPVWDDEMKMSVGNVSFKIFGELEIIASDKNLIQESLKNMETLDSGICLVSGRYGRQIKISTKFNFPGCIMSGASLISFQKNSGYDSWGYTQCGNAPISVEAHHKFCAAINKLKGRSSENKIKLNKNKTLLFWSSENNDICKKAEIGLFTLLSNQHNDPDKNIFKVEELFKGIYSGDIKTTEEDKFYFSVIEGNGSRLSIIYYKECSLKDFASKIHQHFIDMDILDTRKNKYPYKGLINMIKSVTYQGKLDKSIPNLAKNTMKSILEGTCYPSLLYLSCLKRIISEKDDAYVNDKITRIAILKAYLNRKNKNKIMKSKLDKDFDNPGYLCGRLFAALEKEQKDTNNNNQSNIKNVYFASVIDMPCVILTTILKNSIRYEKKLEEGKKIYYNKLMYDDILSKFADRKIPSHLSIDDKGYFFVGYAQQNNEFYTKKENVESEESEKIENE